MSLIIAFFTCNCFLYSSTYPRTEFENFVIEHELAHSKSPKRKGESKAKYENRMNQTALKAIASAVFLCPL